MTCEEFSNMFDSLLNSYNVKADFGTSGSRLDINLDEYEKSVLLTQAQDIIVKSYYDKTLNPQGQGMDDSARRQIDFSSLITNASPAAYSAGVITPYDIRGKLYTMPSNILFMLNEKVTGAIGEVSKDYVVIPLNYKEYDRMMSRAYTQPLKKQCWRLFQSTGTQYDLVSEVIPNSNVTLSTYKIRYVRRPKPIILDDLTGSSSGSNLQIDGTTVKTECELNPIIHVDILNKAVELAYRTHIRAQENPQQNTQQ